MRFENWLSFDQHKTHTLVLVRNRPVTRKTSLYCTSVIPSLFKISVSNGQVSSLDIYFRNKSVSYLEEEEEVFDPERKTQKTYGSWNNSRSDKQVRDAEQVASHAPAAGWCTLQSDQSKEHTAELQGLKTINSKLISFDLLWITCHAGFIDTVWRRFQM